MRDYGRRISADLLKVDGIASVEQQLEIFRETARAEGDGLARQAIGQPRTGRFERGRDLSLRARARPAIEHRHAQASQPGPGGRFEEHAAFEDADQIHGEVVVILEQIDFDAVIQLPSTDGVGQASHGCTSASSSGGMGRNRPMVRES